MIGRLGRESLALSLSVAVHVTVAVLLVIAPLISKKSLTPVDFSIVEKEPEAPPPPPPEPPPDEPEPEERPRAKAAPPPEPPPPPDKPKARRVFDLGDNTFAGEGEGAGWSLNRSEGNSLFGPVQGKDEPSARGTAPEREQAAPTFRPVPIKDLSRRPEPAEGGVTQPPYPDEARREGIAGAVVLQVFIGADGRVKQVRVVRDPGGGLAEVARTAMLKERWKPGFDKAGKPVDTVITYSYRFVLDG